MPEAIGFFDEVTQPQPVGLPTCAEDVADSLVLTALERQLLISRINWLMSVARSDAAAEFEAVIRQATAPFTEAEIAAWAR